MNTAILIKDAKQQNAAAQKCLFDLFADKMLMTCRRYLKNKEDAEEILLDGFYKFFRGLNSFNFQNEAALQAWLKKIMVNECLMFLRKKNVFGIVTEAEPKEPTIAENVFSNLSAAEIFKLIIQLPVGYRTVFNLYVIEGENHKTIAALLNISEGTSKSQLSKARILLQKMLLQKGIDYVATKTK